MVIITLYTTVDHSILLHNPQDIVAHGAFLEILLSLLHVCTTLFLSTYVYTNKLKKDFTKKSLKMIKHSCAGD